MESFRIEHLEIIILTGALVAIIARRLKIPYTVGLVVAGFLLSLFNVQLGVTFSRDLVFNVLLPPLIFEAALYIKWNELKRDLLVVGVFATVGVLISAAVTAGLMYYATGWTLAPAVLFAVLIAATDPVAVIATFREAKVHGRLRLLVESESLFNDATAAVLFGVALLSVAGNEPGLWSALWMLLWSIVGGILSGLLVGGAVFFIIGRTDDNLVELAMTSVAAFGSFWLAEYMHTSGILATTAAGLLIGNLRSFGFLSERGEQSIDHFWDFAAFVANTAVFLLLGVTAAYQNVRQLLWPVTAAIATALISRAAAVYGCSLLFARSENWIKASHQHVLFWGGMRGALALALALGIPIDMPYRQEVITITVCVVAFSVVVQGSTVAWLARRNRL